MIATGLPQEYIPNGRKYYEDQHPGQKFLCQTSNSQLQNIEARPSIITALNNVKLNENVSENEKWILRSKDCCEEELYVNDKTIIWSKGGIGDIKHIKKSFTVEAPVLDALWTSFSSTSSRPQFSCNQHKNDKPEDIINCVCILDSNNLNAHVESGQHFLAPLPFQLKKVWKIRNGLLLERVVPDQEAAAHKKHGEQLPVLFSLLHPLDEVAPVVIKTHSQTTALTSQINFFNGSKQSIVFVSDSDPSLVFTYDHETGQHSVWNIRKALPGEYVMYEREDLISMTGNSFIGTPTTAAAGATNSSLYSRFLQSGPSSPSGIINSPSPIRSFVNSSRFISPSGSNINFKSHQSPSFGNITNMAAMSRSLSPSISHSNPWRISAMSPALNRNSPIFQRLLRSPLASNTSDGESFILQSLTDIQEPLTPDICLDFLWVDSSSREKNARICQAKTVFITTDYIGQNFLCYLFEDLKVLRMVRFEKSNDKKQLIFGTTANIPAKLAVGLKNMLIVLDPNFNLVLYSGVTKISFIHVPNLPVPAMDPSLSNFGLDIPNSTFMGTPRRSSMIPSSRPHSALEARFDDDVHLLSPVPIEVDDSMDCKDSFCNNLNFSVLGNITSLQHGIEHNFTVELTNGNLYRVSLPDISSSDIVMRSLKAIQAILPRDLSLVLYAKWYSARNAPGYSFTTISQEWKSFCSCIMNLMGFNANKLPLIEIFNGESSFSSNEAKRFKVSDTGADKDWCYLLESSYHDSIKKKGCDAELSVFNEVFQATHCIVDECYINCEAQFFAHIPAMFYSLHLVYEELKLNTLLWEDNLNLLATLLLQLSCDLRLETFMDYYCRDFPDLHQFTLNLSSQISDDQLKMLNKPHYMKDVPPSVFRCIQNALTGKFENPFPYIADINNISRNIVLLYSILTKNTVNLNDALQRIIAPGQKSDNWINLSEKLKKVNELNVQKHEKIVFLLYNLGVTKDDLKKLPYGLVLPIRDAIFKTRNNPPTDWPFEAFSLIDREDLAYLNSPKEMHCSINKVGNAHESSVDMRKSSTKQDEETGMEQLDYEILSLRFNQDLRVKEVCRLLQSSKPVPITVQQRPEVSDHDFIEEQEKQLYSLCIRTMSLPVGRGMFTLRSSKPIITEPLPIPKLCLAGKAIPRNTSVDLSHIDVPANINTWPLFHNGVAAGLKISASVSQIDSTWIVYNSPKGANDAPIEHAGFLMALGLNGHLKNLAEWNIHDYLVKGHELTSVGLLLGIAATKRGTMDMTCTKLLSIHVEAFLPPTSVELNVPSVVQVAAVLGIGLVYEGTAHRHTAEVLLSEIGRPPGPEGENCSDRESYSLASGLALGLVTFGRGGEIIGLSDLNVADMLHHYMVGGRKKPLSAFNSEKFKSPSYQIKEGDYVNVDVTSPGATLALGMMFFNTGNKSVAEWMKAPDTQTLLDGIRPDFLLLRTMSHSLVMWDQICPSTHWVESHMSEIIAKHAFKRIHSLDDEIDYESMSQAYCNIIAGACLVLGMKFAGTANKAAFNTIMKYVRRFIQISLSAAVDLAGKMTIETCINTTLLALAMVMAGTGDLEVMKICRYLRSRVGQVSTCILYGSHMAYHMALGILFLGGGRCTLSSSNSAVAAMICAFFPKFPIHSNDNRYHLQAFRHLYALATEPMVLIPRDIDSGLATFAHLTIEYKDTDFYENAVCRLKAPCVIPPLHLLSKVSIEDDIYWPVVFKEDKNWASLKHLLSTDGTVYVKPKAGCLSYLEDPKGYKTLHSHDLTRGKTNFWSIQLETIKAFTSDTNVLNFANFLLQPSCNKEEEGKLLNLLRSILFECITKEKAQILPSYLSIIFGMEKLGTHELTVFDIWQIKLSILFYSFIHAQNNFRESFSTANHEFIFAVKNRVEQILENWIKDNGHHLISYLKQNAREMPLLLACCLVFYDIPFTSQFGCDISNSLLPLFKHLKDNNKAVTPEGIIFIQNALF